MRGGPLVHIMVSLVLVLIATPPCRLVRAFEPASTFPKESPWDVTGLGPPKGFVTAGSAPFLQMEDLSDLQTSPTALHNGGVWTSKRLKKKLVSLAKMVASEASFVNAELYIAAAWIPAPDGTFGNCKATTRNNASASQTLPTLHNEGRAAGKHFPAN